MRDARRASSKIVDTMAESSAKLACSCLIATVRLKPAAPFMRPRYTDAMPPAAKDSKIW